MAAVNDWSRAKGKGGKAKKSGLDHSLDSLGKSRVNNRELRGHDLRAFWSHNKDEKREQIESVRKYIFGLSDENILEDVSSRFDQVEAELDDRLENLIAKHKKD